MPPDPNAKWGSRLCEWNIRWMHAFGAKTVQDILNPRKGPVQLPPASSSGSCRVILQKSPQRSLLPSAECPVHVQGAIPSVFPTGIIISRLLANLIAIGHQDVSCCWIVLFFVRA